MIERFFDWPGRLEAAVRRRVETPFAYGDHDCCLAACAGVEAMTGVDIAAHLRGYAGEFGALRVISEHGGFLPLCRSVARRHDLEEIAPTYAQRGDLAYLKARAPSGLEMEFLGLVWLDGRHIFIADETGWGKVPLADALVAWRVG